MYTLKLQKEFDIPADILWNVVAREYANVSDSHPAIVKSEFINGHSEVKLGSERLCNFDEQGKQYLKERIVEFDEKNRTFTNMVWEAGQFPIDTGKTQGTFIVDELGNGKSKVTFIMNYQTKPALMGSLVKSQFKKRIKDYFISIEHYARTGEKITLENFKSIRKQYNDEAKKIEVIA